MKNIIPVLAVALLLIPMAAAVRAEQFSSSDGVVYQFRSPVGFTEKRSSNSYLCGDIAFEKGVPYVTGLDTIAVSHEHLPEVQGNQRHALQEYASSRGNAQSIPGLAEIVDCGIMNGNPTCTLTTPNLLHQQPPHEYFIQNKHTVFDLDLSIGGLNATSTPAVFKAFVHSFKVVSTPEVHEIQ